MSNVQTTALCMQSQITWDLPTRRHTPLHLSAD